MSKKVAIVGLGWLGEALAVSMHEDGALIQGSTASVDALNRLVKHPFYVGRIEVEQSRIVGDWEAFIAGISTLVIGIPPKRIDDIEVVYAAQMQQIIAHTPSAVKVVFISTTAVYSNTNDTVTESAVCEPDKASGRAILEAERLLQDHFDDVAILRLAGFIGPDRHPGRFLAEKRPLRNPNVPLNLIHREDSISLIKQVVEQDCYGEIINGCADVHPIREAFYIKAAKDLDLPQPTFLNSDKVNYKVIDNIKSKTLLGFEYGYSNPEAIFSKENLHEVAIVGAGPGAKGLLTVEAHDLIDEADVILHDNLVSDEIMALNTTAELIYVGRKFGDDSHQGNRQLKINELLHQCYKEGRKVVRLKSGDSYVFGRAAEEARYLVEHNVPFKVLPGISAALAAANICNIPITERGQANAVLICTAHTADYETGQIDSMAQSLKQGSTLAVYMGLKSLSKMLPKLIVACENDTIPINAVSNVSRPNQVLMTSSLGEIENDIQKQPLEMPVVFLIGAKAIQPL